jgi:FixJ family two-component response regulator
VICVVDDDESMLNSVRRLLEPVGFEVQTFGHPADALDYMAQNRVALAILDIRMQGMNGLELLAHLCARSPGTHVIFMTGREDRAAEAMVMQAGAFAFLIKPVEADEFLATVRCAVADRAGT